MLHIRLSDPEQAPSLCEFFAGASARARPAEARDLVAIELPNAPSRLHEWREVANYITTWRLLRGGCRAEVVDPPEAGPDAWTRRPAS